MRKINGTALKIAEGIGVAIGYGILPAFAIAVLFIK